MAASLKPDEFESMATLGDIPRHHGRVRPDDIALSFEGRNTTYGEFDRHTAQVAAALAKAAVKLIFPLLLFIFPALLIVLMGPALIKMYELFYFLAE